MKKLHLVASASTLALPLAAQEKSHAWQGYGYYGFGARGEAPYQDSMYNTYGAGAEGFLYRGLALGIDGGYLSQVPGYSAKGFVLVAPDVSYHIGRGRKFVPFAAFGVGGIASDYGFGLMAHLGGGFSYWFKDRVGVRVEYRQVQTSSDIGALPMIRFGVTFR